MTGALVASELHTIGVSLAQTVVFKASCKHSAVCLTAVACGWPLEQVLTIPRTFSRAACRRHLVLVRKTETLCNRFVLLSVCSTVGTVFGLGASHFWPASAGCLKCG